VDLNAIKRRTKNDLDLILASGLFDVEWYNSIYPDVVRSGQAAEIHYLTIGGFEGYDPCEIFSSNTYLEMYPDVKKARINPLVHYVRIGKQEGRIIEVSNRTGTQPSEMVATKRDFYRTFGFMPNLFKPQTFNEKIQAYKLFYHRQDLAYYADKIKVRDYVRNAIGEEFLIPFIGVFSDPDEIDFDQLPEQFVIKATHGSGWTRVCFKKSELDWQAQKFEMRNWLNSNYFDKYGEYAYKNIPPRLIIENLMMDESGEIPKDFKLYCYDGEPMFIQVDFDRLTNHTRNFYNLQWNRLYVSKSVPQMERYQLRKPPYLEKMIEISRVLSKSFPFVRVDLYSMPTVFFGELSFYPSAGYSIFKPQKWDLEFGKHFKVQGIIDRYLAKDRQDPYDPTELVRLRSKRYNFDFSCFPQNRADNEFIANEDMTSNLIRQMAKGVKTFIDIGAGCGFYSILAGKSNPELEIHCFEPVHIFKDLLKCNLADNHIQASVHSCFTSETDGDIEIDFTNRIGEFWSRKTDDLSTVQFVNTQTKIADELFRNIPNGPILLRIDSVKNKIKTFNGFLELIERTSDIRVIIRHFQGGLIDVQQKTSELVAYLQRLGFDVFVVDEENKQYHRYSQSDKELDCRENSYVNLVCLKKERSANILFFSHSSYLFGAERSLMDLVGNLTAKYGILCTVVLPSDGLLRPALESLGAAIKIIPYSWWCAQPDFLPDKQEINKSLAASYKEMYEHLLDFERIDPDAIVTSTMVIPWGTFVAKYLNRPHIWWVKEYGDLDHGLSFYFPFDEILKVITTSSNYVVVPSDSLLDTHFSDIAGKKGLVAYNLKPEFSPGEQVQTSCFSDSAALKLLIFGVVRESKGQAEAVMAVHRLIEKGRNVELCILGHANNPFGEKLKVQVQNFNISDRVHFLNFTPAVQPFIEQSDLVLMCSRNEAFGRTTVEAMLLGKPVIGTRSGGTTELIEDGVNGLLYTPGNVDQLVDCIEFFLNMPEKVKEFGESSREHILRKLAEKPVDDLMYNLFLEVKSKANPGSKELADLGTNWCKTIPLSLMDMITDLESSLIRFENKTSELEANIKCIELSKEWKLALFMRRLRTSLAPDNSPQLKFAKMIFGLLKRDHNF